MKKIVIYPGRFHPFHKGHASVYNTLVKQFGAGSVYIATSDKVDPPKSPFTFSEKAQMMNFAGVPDNAIMLTKQPYRPVELLDGEDPNTVVMFAVSEKDMAEDPRFAFKPLKNGNPSYFQPAEGNDMKGWEQHGYIITVPTLQFKVLDQPMKSATEFRRDFASADAEKQKAMITDLYGKYDMNIHSIMSNKITEDAVFKKDKKFPNLKTPTKPTKYTKRKNAIDFFGKRDYTKIDDSQNRINKIIETINELEASNALNAEQKLSILGKLQRLFIEMRLHRNRAVLESLYSVDKDDIMNSEVLVTGVGRYSIKGLMQNISAKLDDLSKEASEMTPYNYKNIKAKLDSGILSTMLDSLIDAYADLETMRRKGGANSRAIPKNMFDDVQLDELQVTQRDALRVLYNVAARKDNKSFPVRMYNKDVIGNPNAPGAGVGTVMVTPKQAELITKIYDNGTDDVKKSIERKLKTYGGWEELLKMIPSKFQEAWSQKYKDSIDCSNPKGFSQKAHCAGRNKTK